MPVRAGLTIRKTPRTRKGSLRRSHQRRRKTMKRMRKERAMRTIQKQAAATLAPELRKWQGENPRKCDRVGSR